MATRVEIQQGVDGIKESADAATESVNNLNEAGKETGKIYGQTNKILQAFGVGMKDTTDNVNEAVSSFEIMKRVLKDTVSILKVSLLGSLVGAAKGFTGAIRSLTAFQRVVSSVAKGVSHLAVTIIAIPFKILEGLIEMANNHAGSLAILEAWERVRETFGDLAKGVVPVLRSQFQDARASAGNLAGAGISLGRIYGWGPEGVAKMMDELREVATKMGPLFDAQRDSLMRYGAEMIVFKRGLGLTDEALKSLSLSTFLSGKSLDTTFKEMANLSLQVGERFGMSAKQISRDVGEMIGDFANFGTRSVKEMTKAAVFTRKLGIEVKSLLGLIDKFDNFEDAANATAQLAQSFGIQVDALQMMNATESERLEILRKGFMATGRSVEQMTRQELKLLQATTGLDAQAVTMAFSQKNVATTLDSVSSATDAAASAQKTQTEIMQDLGKAIERVYQQGNTYKNFWDAFLGGLGQGILWGKGFYGMLRNIRHSMRITERLGRDVGRLFVATAPGIQDMIKATTELFNPKRFEKMREDVRKVFEQFFKDLSTDPKAGFKTFINNLQGELLKFFKDAGNPGGNIMKGAKKFGTALFGIYEAILPMAIHGLTEIVKDITAFIKNPGNLLNPLSDATRGPIMQVVMVLVDTLKENAPPLINALKDLFTTIYDKVEPYLIKIGQATISYIIVKSIAGGIAGAVVGGGIALAGKALMNLFGMLWDNARNAITKEKMAAVPAGPTVKSQSGSTYGGTGGVMAAAVSDVSHNMSTLEEDVNKGGLKSPKALFQKILPALGVMVGLAAAVVVAGAAVALVSMDTLLKTAVAMPVIGMVVFGSMEALKALQLLPDIGKGIATKTAAVAGVMIALVGVAAGASYLGKMVDLAGLVQTAGAMVLMVPLFLATGALFGLSAIFGLIAKGLAPATAGVVAAGVFMLLLMPLAEGISLMADKFPAKNLLAASTSMALMSSIFVSTAIAGGSAALMAVIGIPALLGLLATTAFMGALVLEVAMLEKVFDFFGRKIGAKTFIDTSKSLGYLSLVFLSTVGIATAAAVMVPVGLFGILGLGVTWTFLKSLQIGMPVLMNLIESVAKTPIQQVQKTAIAMVKISSVFASIALVAASLAAISVGSLAMGIASLGKDMTEVVSGIIGNILPIFGLLKAVKIEGTEAEFKLRLMAIETIMSVVPAIAKVADSLSGMVQSLAIDSKVDFAGPLKVLGAVVEQIFSGAKNLVTSLSKTTGVEIAADPSLLAAKANIIGGVASIIGAVTPNMDIFQETVKEKKLFGRSSETKKLAEKTPEILGGMTMFVTKLFEAVSTNLPMLVERLANLNLPANAREKFQIVGMAIQVVKDLVEVGTSARKDLIETLNNPALAGAAAAVIDEQTISTKLRGMIIGTVDAVSAALGNGQTGLIATILTVTNEFENIDVAKLKERLEVLSMSVGLVSVVADSVSKMMELAKANDKGGVVGGLADIGNVPVSLNIKAARLKDMIGSLFTKDNGGFLWAIQEITQTVMQTSNQLIGESVAKDVMERIQVVKTSIDVVNTLTDAIGKAMRSTGKTPLDMGKGTEPLSLAPLIEIIKGDQNGNNSLMELVGQMSNIKVDNKGADAIVKNMANVERVTGSFTKASDAIVKARDGSIKLAVKAVNDIITEMTNIDKGLSNLGDVTFKSLITKFGDSVRVGSQKFEISNKPVSITINLDLKMDADELVAKLAERKNTRTIVVKTEEVKQ